jgi:hypothetical protein
MSSILLGCLLLRFAVTLYIFGRAFATAVVTNNSVKIGYKLHIANVHTAVLERIEFSTHGVSC